MCSLDLTFFWGGGGTRWSRFFSEDLVSPDTVCTVFSTCPLHTNSGCGKREANIDWSIVMQRQAHPLLEPSIFSVLHVSTVSTVGVGKIETHIDWSMCDT